MIQAKTWADFPAASVAESGLVQAGLQAFADVANTHNVEEAVQELAGRLREQFEERYHIILRHPVLAGDADALQRYAESIAKLLDDMRRAAGMLLAGYPGALGTFTQKLPFEEPEAQQVA